MSCPEPRPARASRGSRSHWLQSVQGTPMWMMGEGNRSHAWWKAASTNWRDEARGHSVELSS